MAERPDRLVMVTGTETEVGKTWVGAALASAWRDAGHRVAARKPVQSYRPGTGPTDAHVLAAATGEHPDEVCPPHRSYEVAMAPFMAAAKLGRPPFTLAELVAEIVWPDGVDVGLVEAAGGVRSPMTTDGGDTVDLVEALAPDDVVVVAHAGLGTINAVRLCVAALAGQPVRVFLNRFDARSELHLANQAWLAAHLPVPVVVRLAALVED